VPFLDQRGVWIANGTSSPAVVTVNGVVDGAVPPSTTVLVSLPSEATPGGASAVEVVVASRELDGRPCGARVLLSSKVVASKAPILLSWGTRHQVSRAPDPLSTRTPDPAPDSDWVLPLLAKLRGDKAAVLATEGPTVAPTTSTCETMELIVFPPFTGRYVNSLGMEFVLIPPSVFQMGSAQGYKIERPFQATISKPFWMGVTEVTQAQWQKIMESSPSAFKGDTLPVEFVTHADAVRFCQQLSARDGRRYRLPTEAEWECACRAGTTTEFQWGNDAGLSSRFAWTNQNAKESTHPVGRLAPNAWGLQDMGGNVVEWCADWFSWRNPVVPTVDPRGPQRGTGHVRRGGFWGFYPSACRSAGRDNGPMGYAESNVGFRVVME